MKYGILAGIAVLGLSMWSACNSSTTPPPAPTPTLQDEYEPMDAVPTTGGITQITFDSTTQSYTAKRTVAAGADEILVPETGTFTLDVAGGTLTLNPHAGMAQTLSFQVGLTATEGGTSQGMGLHTQGLVSTIKLILSFLLDGHWFHTDTPAVPDTGTDDAGWPGADGSVPIDVDATAPGCSADASVAPSPLGHGQGIDVSHYQGIVNWGATGRSFGYAKATEGTSYTDPTFAKNYSAMKAAGLERGGYHFFRASKDPTAQADFFANTLMGSGFDERTDLQPMVDVEVTDGVSASTLISELQTFITEAEGKLGVTLMIYTGPSFWKNTLGNPDFSSHPLWIAHYTKAAQPTIPSTWSTYTIWQYSQSDTVSGISGPVDGDRWNGALAGPADGGTGGRSGGACMGDSGPVVDASGDAIDEGLIPGGCTHDVCTAGVRLGQACNSCTMVVCQNDPYCCDTYWGVSCFPDVQMYCGITCP